MSPHPREEAFQKVLTELERAHTESGVTEFEVGFLRGLDGGWMVTVFESSTATETVRAEWQKRPNLIHIPKAVAK